ncbi:hypothetical protein NBRC116587_29460 [Pseudoteredinibacter isoporae]
MVLRFELLQAFVGEKGGWAAKVKVKFYGFAHGRVPDSKRVKGIVLRSFHWGIEVLRLQVLLWNLIIKRIVE